MPQKITFTTKPKTKFEIPVSEGYQLYSAILNIIRDNDEKVSEYAHDSSIGSMAISNLSGKFKKDGRPNYKTIDPESGYKFNIGITDPKEVEIFKSIIQPLILKERNIKLDKGELRVEEVTSSSISFEELLSSVKDSINPSIGFRFKSPACIQYKNSKVFEMFPHREAVFTSLISKWNAVCPAGMKMSIERDEIARYVMERPDTQLYKTHNVMVNTVFDKAKGHHRPIFRQGFTGKCTYMFAKNAPQDVRNGILVLSEFASYSGVGSAVSRGCGWVDVEVGEVK
ncbi:MAG: CRISPR system precrRNA processing endoribonuclease RAMP protein Cas6 [ANME-2 cluster archaeon]|jgi:CRISPR-associated endoribonuclease Cas6|nr:CRISPR system precrRNA processing endoribonuclease RAMP protein Cas6 [ANME-2 cluster archaeon]